MSHSTSRRGLKPSEFKKLQELGFTREQAEEYAQSGFLDVDEWIEGKKLNADPEEFTRYKRSDFENFEQFQLADKAGFESRDEYDQAMGGNFPNRASWLLAREMEIFTYKKYLDHKAEQKSLDSLVPQPSKQLFETQETTPKTSDSEDTVSYMKPEFKSISQKKQPMVSPLKSETFVGRSPTSRKLVSPEPDSAPRLAPEKVIAQAHQGSSIEELLEKYPLPEINFLDFIDNPSLEQMFRFAEVLEQTLKIDLEDFTAALSFIDVYDIEEWLSDQFDPDLFQVNFENNLITFKPEIYPIVISNLRK